MKAFRLLATSLLVALSMGFVSCDEDNENKDIKEKNIYFITDESEQGKYGDGTYIKTNSSYYKDRDGNSWHRDNIFAPRENESINDESYQQRTKTGEYAPQENAYDNGYEEGYERGYEEAKKIFIGD